MFVITPDPQSDQGQHQEAFYLETASGKEYIRLHDYERIYQTSGLYEAIIQDKLECQSPDRLAAGLQTLVTETGFNDSSASLLDVGAGNGLVGEKIQNHQMAFKRFALDAEPLAESAYRRDRPGIYQNYFTAYLDQLDYQKMIAVDNLKIITSSSALSDTHIGAKDFIDLWEAMPESSLLAITVPAGVVEQADHPLGEYLHRLSDQNQVYAFDRFRHRYSTAGREIIYYLVTAQKG